MQLEITETVTTKYVLCPCCNSKLGSINHLVEGTYAWYCDACGNRIKFKMHQGCVVDSHKTGETKEKTLVFLKRGGIGLIVEGMSFNSENNDEYFYNEHTCPTNYLSCVVAIVDLEHGDPDPHGIFEYVTTLPWVEGFDECNFNIKPYIENFEYENS